MFSQPEPKDRRIDGETIRIFFMMHRLESYACPRLSTALSRCQALQRQLVSLCKRQDPHYPYIVEREKTNSQSD
jgi:hypothetical protein